ncbi:MAG TPA: hypothetical protein VFY39_02480 [Gammaproteobacteria bacterium]|nr:hypothetical protein [Gammaproteobacteria bacterium]
MSLSAIESLRTSVQTCRSPQAPVALVLVVVRVLVRVLDGER